MTTKVCKQAATLLSKHGALAGTVAHRMAFKTAFNDGKVALDTEPRGTGFRFGSCSHLNGAARRRPRTGLGGWGPRHTANSG